MKPGNTVEVKDLKKQFTVKYTTFYGGIAKSGTKQVLNGLSFEVKKGEVLGIIGKNGSGKSTLLKILAKIMGPDSGLMELKGNVASILELGMGFDPEASGRINIRTKCGLYGLNDDEIDACIDDIITFSELGEQVDHPLRTYSSGMTAKLAFSVLMHVKCDILIIDEVLSVGDAGFNSKCRLAFQRMKKSGHSIILASHNMSIMKDMCDRVMWIDEGIVREIGDPISVCYHYESDLTDSLDTVLKMADSGDVVSMNRVGVMYRDGISTEYDKEKAELYLSKAASMGYVEAYVNLADMRLKEGNKKEAKEWYSKAAQLGNAIAINALMYIEDDSGEREELVEEIRVLASEGNSRAMKILADMLYNGNICLKDQKEALQWYEKCSVLHNNQAQYTAGICYRDGIGVNKDSLKAVGYLEMAHRHGNMRARIELANMYRKGIGVERDMAKAIQWYEIAANCGDSNSMLQLGQIYREGQGIEQNDEIATMWMKRYSQLTFANSAIILADLIKQGYSGYKQRECIKWYEMAADKGNVAAMNSLGAAYYDGILTNVNVNRALDYYLKASERYSSSGLLGSAKIMLENENETNIRKALETLRIASNLGNNQSSSLLSSLLINNPSLQEGNELKKLLIKLSETGDMKARAELQSLCETGFIESKGDDESVEDLFNQMSSKTPESQLIGTNNSTKQNKTEHHPSSELQNNHPEDERSQETERVINVKEEESEEREKVVPVVIKLDEQTKQQFTDGQSHDSKNSNEVVQKNSKSTPDEISDASAQYNNSTENASKNNEPFRCQNGSIYYGTLDKNGLFSGFGTCT
ncbi:MAG: SEL1-like repeat protein [Candidatus Methanomethylophilaceae archaeon]|nr:SEL1-like repeat protein [Candidatus Methanomethylophilaceae archaeon]